MSKNSLQGLQVFRVTSLLLCSWIVIYAANGTMSSYTHVFYIPIILAAWFWRVWGGTIVGLISSILSGPLMPLEVSEHLSQPLQDWSIRTVFFIGIGLLVGYILHRYETQRLSLELRNKELAASNKEVREQRKHLQESGTELIETLAHTIEIRDAYTNGHCARVADLSVQIGKRLGLNEDELLHLRWAALIHDIGKIGIPESILNKPDRLTPEEYSVIKSHASLGEWVLSNTRHGVNLKDGVGSHHERWDGKGYPSGLSGNSIPLQARIITVADVWDALSTERAYRKPLDLEERLKVMRDGSGTWFDPGLLSIFLEIINDTGAALEARVAKDRYFEW